MEYQPIVYTLPKLKDDIFKTTDDYQMSSVIDYPKFSLGFQHFLHQSKAKMSITKQFDGKKKVYLVINEFERYVDDYEQDINSVSRTYFHIDPIPDILSRAFYKLWEIYFMFDLVPLDSTKFRSVHLCEGPGSFVQATIFLRDKMGKKGVSKDDKYHAVTLHCEDDDENTPELANRFINYYKKEKPERFILHKTYPKSESKKSDKKDNGDITDIKTINNFTNEFKKDKADLVTADGGFPWVNENTQEQEAFRLILGQILTTIRVQAKGGHFICKFYETFTNVSTKILCMLQSLYKDVHVVKPVMSRKSNSEKYLVCMDFLDSKSVSKCDAFITKVLSAKGNIVDLFSEYTIPTINIATITSMNMDIANRQFVAINEMVDFIEKQNYRGETYHQKRKNQIEASNLYTGMFFPDNKDFPKQRESIQNKVKKIIGDSEKRATEFHKVVDYS